MVEDLINLRAVSAFPVLTEVLDHIMESQIKIFIYIKLVQFGFRADMLLDFSFFITWEI